MKITRNTGDGKTKPWEKWVWSYRGGTRPSERQP